MDKQSADSPEIGAAELDQLQVDLREVKENAAWLSELLRVAADKAASGTAVTLSDLADQVSEHERMSAAFLRAMSPLGPLPVEPSFDELEKTIRNARDELVKREQESQLAARRADMEQKVAEIERLLETATGSLRDALMHALTVARSELAELLPATSPDTADEPQEPTGQDQRAVEIHSPPAEEPVPAASEARLSEQELPEHAESEPESEELTHAFPWEQGKPPPAVQLVQAGRLAEAYWVTAVSAEPDPRTAVLRFACAAYAASDPADAAAVQSAFDLDVQIVYPDRDALVLATTGLLRVALVAGWYHPLLEQLYADLRLPEAWQAMVDACVVAVRHGYRVLRPVGAAPADDDEAARADLGRRADELLAELPHRRNPYQRASLVLRHLARNQQPLATALRAVVDWANGSTDGDEIATMLGQLTAPDAADAMIEAADAAVRTPKQAKEHIVAAARRGLNRAIDDVVAIVRDADRLRRRTLRSEVDDRTVADQLARALTRVDEATVPAGMAGASVALLRFWLHAPGTSHLALAADGEPSVEPLLPLADLPRDPDGRPDRDHQNTPAVLARLAEPLDLVSAVTTYRNRGDLRRARRIVELAEENMWPGAADPAILLATLSTAEEELTRRHRAELTRARDLFARVRVQNLLDPSSESEVARRIAALSPEPNGAFDTVLAGLAALTSELEGRQDRQVGILRNELRIQQVSESDRARIAALLDEGDTVTAAEFLAFVRAGLELPTHPGPATHDLVAFTELLARGRDEGLVKPHTGAADWAGLALRGAELARSARVGVEAWDSLANTEQHVSDQMAGAVRDILGTLGLPCESRPQELDRRTRRGFRKFSVRGRPKEKSYVSAFGSSAIDYTVLVVVEELRNRSVLDLFDEGDTNANIVLYLHPMDLAARRSLAVRAAAKGAVQAFVVDPAVLGWVAAIAPGSWRATQRVTLPWTAIVPYTPFVAGSVPPEVFVGRRHEMAQVVDPHGGLFLYGGRQQGKTALLRRVEETFNDESHHAVYLDLKGRGIGETEPPEGIWRELILELRARGVLPAKASTNEPAESVVKQVRNWLKGNPARRLLLLVDEADAFLTADSRPTHTVGGVAHFPNVLRLKELMESTDRRFKVVFTGLHQVQRFSHLSNVPLAHGGPDVLVGPLDPKSARQLVEEPMAALGYAFERPDLVWRLLSQTNYQAALIQIFCAELVTNLHNNRTPSPDPMLVRIREEDLEAVAMSDRIHGLIAERLRITVHLDDRYRVLTLVIALLSLDDSFTADYSPNELLEHARKYWPAGFDELNVSQVGIYLDEMVDLGLLVRPPGGNRYAVRSPNVVNMLGARADLERELAETAFDLPYEYNPREARRLLFDDGVRQYRSPLTEGQLAGLATPGGVAVVAGTEALGIQRVTQAITNYAENRDRKVHLCRSVAEATKAVTKGRLGQDSVVVADLRGTAPDGLGQELTGRPPALILIVEPAAADAAAKALGREPVRLERWTANGIRSWPECPFDTVESRTRLIQVTGGWPELVELAIAEMTGGATRDQALERIQQVWQKPDNAAKLLADTGLDAVVVERLGAWFDFTGTEPGDPAPLPPGDVAELLDLGIDATHDLLDALSGLGVLDETADGVALDRVVHRCLASMRGQS